MTADVRRALGVATTLAWAGATVLIIVAILNGCTWVKSSGKGLVDCTTSSAKDAVHQFGPVVDALLAQATSPDGKVNWSPVKDLVKGFGVELGGCVLSSVVAAALHPAQAAPDAPKASELVFDPVSLRSGFEQLRASQFGGRTFMTASGVL